MNLNQIHNVYFIGIGGIGMSALARYFKYAGKNVVGYDKTPTELTSVLESKGIAVHFQDDVNFIPKDFTKENTLVVITPAVPKSHSEWNYFLDHGYTVKKRAEVLGIITKDTFCFAVAGTHGKTTTSSILGHVLFESGVDMTAFLGGIVENYDSNLIGNGTKVTVVEADEFDRSFLHLHPNIACVTSMDADHLDIYGDSASIETSFREFADKVDDKGMIFVAQGLSLEGMTVAVNKDADFKAFNIRIDNGEYLFDVQTPNEIIPDLRFALPGWHNLSNALMALAMARTFGVSADNIRKALISFKGIKRRFSYQIKTTNRVYIDDYAHHPTEINAVHQAVRELYAGKKVVAIFQPHLFSRTKDFADDFAKSLSNFDQVLLLDIYPARELPMEGVTSEWLLSKIENPNKKLVLKTDLIHEIMDANADVVVTIGAGDIGELVPEIKKALS
ncbi:UDP-N-acetylmuramate--L-alanine ligase [Flavobacterium sp. MAH-1]|uniref:UDP-N-acetylmuramate--L-alanine ligase n=1 Tax=Flavobacterium agri TaxID=2743471 RepID=A0A7Y8Y5N7_9FLAO|nr:UDP-N-acetylmuramate--L-alanine ligase [Flavobacterium agri]NUY81726.1 UDP-N-acetylmuramate--L-alanine ligase [Flavobacterium agri]NYA71750.1 UDP-N-acetylmuramate--L-alanine ligase [Flavobacterium agri]